MYWLTYILLLTAAFAVDDIAASPAQVSFQVQDTKPKKLHGRFLHITDIHPDPHYAPHAAESTACHRKKSKKKKNVASYYGTPYAECDSPFRLTNFTLDYLKDNWANEIDFVVCTHDNDRKIPRTPSEINDLNRVIADKMDKVFTKQGVPVVPSLGNNDVWHQTGPNSITNEFASIWKSFIPFPYLQVFQRGHITRLNTMYFYDSNKVVAGCPYKQPNDPGNLQFDWLEVQLEMYRHVPPSSGNYFPECYVRYVDLALRYQDTILGHLFGFFFLEAADLEIFPALDGKSRTTSEADLFQTLVDNWGSLPKSANLTEYAVVNVAPSIVPNPYTPAFRVFSYNTKEEKAKKAFKTKAWPPSGGKGDKNVHCKTEEYRDTWRCHLGGSWYHDPNSPSQLNQRWTPLGYAQVSIYYIPKLKRANKTHTPVFELEYLTYPIDSLHPNDVGREFQYPVPLGLLPETLREGGAEKSKYAPYRMGDLTIGSWIRLARQIADSRGRKVQRRFRKYMYLE
ncbi:hypothetical protein CPB84DRAFT_1811392 [Gymnopilus junonius]|uniref:Calcineurin-like phosphoesterase domain-containing protein n=1 Tax=Gymnopilus junonius TaxID=109634 RepID=A0A9P5TV06_GYMJU|nr:hypothetical protein CPB84DRAFT_1811392 [Gymnopilus junonius]